MAWTIDFSGKNAVVTGGSRGIGLAISRLLAECGARVIIVYRSDEEAANAALATLAGDGHWAVKADLSNAIEAQEIAAECSRLADGGIDFVVLNAAGGGGGLISEASDEEWRRSYDVNIHGNVAVLRGVSASMNSGGAVVFIGSGAGHDPFVGMGAYGSSKAAVIHLASILAQEWGPRGIRVNVVSPGSTSKAEIDYEHLSDGQKEIVQTTALRRIGTTQDVAKAVLFFLSDLSGFVTGQVIRCNGGRV